MDSLRLMVPAGYTTHQISVKSGRTTHVISSN
jgi:hypothetical protein